jgi:hypothetical protein
MIINIKLYRPNDSSYFFWRRELEIPDVYNRLHEAPNGCDV